MTMKKEKKEGEGRGYRTSVINAAPLFHLVIKSVKRVSEFVLFAFFFLYLFLCVCRDGS